MKVREAINKLMEFNMDADVLIIDDNNVGRNIEYYGYGGSDNCTKEKCMDVTFGFTDSKPVTEIKKEEERTFKGFSEEQLKWIETTLICNKHSDGDTKYTRDDIKYDNFGNEPFGCYVISLIDGRSDIVGINLGFYSDGKFYYHPVVDGTFRESIQIELKNAVACILYK